MTDPPTWELTAYERSDGFHYARRHWDDGVERHYDFTPCGCPNAAEYGPALPRGIHDITINVTVQVQIRNGTGDGILYEDTFPMPWDCNPMDVTWRADARVMVGCPRLFDLT